MAKTKGDLVLKALRKAGLYSNATLTDADPQAIEDAINDLEDMMAAWQAKGIELGYQFADTENGIMPLPDDDSGIPAWANDGVALIEKDQVTWQQLVFINLRANSGLLFGFTGQLQIETITHRHNHKSRTVHTAPRHATITIRRAMPAL